MVIVKLEGNMFKKITLLGIVTAIVILAVCIGPATAITYTNYDAIWTSSGNQLIMENWLTGIAAGTTPTHYAGYYSFTMAPSSTTVMNTPFVNTISKTGVHPHVRYLYFELKMPTGVNVTWVTVYDGATSVYSKGVTWAGTGAVKDYTLDMGSYHDMVRGIQISIIMDNSLVSKQDVNSYGAGAKQEW
jgi:hypothetical protein